MSIRDEVENVVRKFFMDKMDKRTSDLRHCALFDLQFGPMPAEYYRDSADVSDWPGYTSAVETLETWASENLMAVWVDPQTMDVMEVEPEVDLLSEVYHFDRRDVAKIVFRTLVTHGGMSA